MNKEMYRVFKVDGLLYHEGCTPNNDDEVKENLVDPADLDMSDLCNECDDPCILAVEE